MNRGTTTDAYFKNSFGSMPACFRIALSVPSGMSPGWFGMVVKRPDGLRQISWEPGLAVELEAGTLESANNLPVGKTREAPHFMRSR